jgi:hypothetical protein
MTGGELEKDGRPLGRLVLELDHEGTVDAAEWPAFQLTFSRTKQGD